MSQPPTRRNAMHKATSAVLPSHTPSPTSGPQGVIRTRTGHRHHHRLSPLHVPRRHFPDQLPFGPQIPLQIASTRGRQPVPTQVVSVVPEKKPGTSSPGTVSNFLDATFRSYAERIQTELTHLRAVCTKVMCKERQERNKWRAHCVTFKEERDAARERVRAMLCERESLRGFEAALNAKNGEGSQQARSSVSRGVKRAASFTETNIPEPENAISRRSSYPSSASPSSTTAVHSDTGSLEEEEEAGVYTLLYQSPRTHAFPPFTMSLPPLSHTLPPLQRSRSAGPVLSGPSFTPFDSAALPRRSSASEGGDWDLNLPPLDPESIPLDIMYGSKDGQLQCRVCMLLRSKSSASASTSSPTLPSFPRHAKWEELRDHCVNEHPRECADVARLKPTELYELRRRIHVSRES